MRRTRERILEVIVQRRDIRVEEIAAALNITGPAVRRHLDLLRAERLVGIKTMRQPMGRPYYVYFPTEKALGQLPPSYADLLRRMLESIGEREEVVGAVMESVAEALAARHRADLVDVPMTAEQRIDAVTQSLREDGILDTWRADEDGFHLTNGTCPYLKAAEISSLPCDSDRKAIEILLGGEVEQLHRIVDGSPVCEYLVRALRGRQDLKPVE